MHKFFPHTVKSWNNLSFELKNCQSLVNFKRNVLALIRPNYKSAFSIFDTVGLKYIFQLRVGLSPLRHHKRRHNFNNIPSEICICLAESENSSHFLLRCHLFSVQRHKLFSAVSVILIKHKMLHLLMNIDTYLYGNSALPDADNREIIKSTIIFVKETRRFSKETVT